MTSIDIATHVREHERLAWTRTVTGRDDATLVRASVDAGFRTYWRATIGDGDSTADTSSGSQARDRTGRSTGRPASGAGRSEGGQGT